MKGCNWSRRELLLAAVGAGSLRQLAFSAQTSSRADAGRLAMPGPYRGRLVAIEHPGCVVNGTFYREPIRQMFPKGIMELTGAPDPVAAWKVFFQPGDVVGIKLSGVGYPHVCVLQTVIEGVRSAGLKSNDILVYERYRQELLRSGYDKWLPEGVRWGHAVEAYERVQQATEGYDPDHYMEMKVVLPGQDTNNPTFRRSYVSRVIDRDINKLINIPTLNDHQSAGVTPALKNLSHGSVNNVERSHSTPTLNVCGAFIPAVVSPPRSATRRYSISWTAPRRSIKAAPAPGRSSFGSTGESTCQPTLWRSTASAGGRSTRSESQRASSRCTKPNPTNSATSRTGRWSPSNSPAHSAWAGSTTKRSTCAGSR